MSVSSQSYNVDVLLVTVTDGETRAVFDAFQAKTGRRAVRRDLGAQIYYELGVIAGASIWLVRSEMGGQGPGSAFTTISGAIGDLAPAAIIMVGIAFGTQPRKQQIGDVLVARQIVSYEPQRIGTSPEGTPVRLSRGDRTSSSVGLLARCRAGALEWPGQGAHVYIGPVLSGEKLLDHQPTVAQLLADEPEAIGGEMEGAALSAVASQSKVDWMLIKAISDWADGHKGQDKQQRQELAARNAAAFTLHVLEGGGFARPVRGDASATPLPVASSLLYKQRVDLLYLLQRRYAERLDSALAHQVRLQIGLHTRPDAVDPVWRRLHLRGSLESRPLPPDIPLLELFESQQRQLLVLGAPGAGKTTLMLELAQALLARAQSERQARIPVLLNLAAWRSGQNLREWLEPTLRDLLGVSRRFAAQLAKSDDLLLLLDGLDEVSESHRAACVAAVNAYLGESDFPPPIVVGCRSREYAGLETSLAISGAVELEPLELATIQRALASVPAAQGVLTALQTDPLLPELARTPLIVNVLLLAHADQEVPIVQAQSIEERRRALWAAYVRRMLWQRPLKRWKSARALGWLRWVARTLQARNQTDLLLDELKLDVLPLKPWRALYTVLMFLIGGLVGAGMSMWLGEILTSATVVLDSTRFREFYDLNILKTTIFMACILFGSGFLGIKPIDRAERIVWSGKLVLSSIPGSIRDRRFIFLSMMSMLMMGLIGFLIGALGRYLSILVVFSVIAAFVGLLFVVGVFGLIHVQISGWMVQDLTERVFPIQGIWHSLLTSLCRWFVGILVFGLGFCFLIGIIFSVLMGMIGYLHIGRFPNLLDGVMVGLYLGSHIGMLIGIVIGFFVGFMQGLFSGLGLFVQYYSLRLMLAWANLLPLRAVVFMEAMAAGLLLERDGAFYRFRHILLRDFFAELSDSELALLVAGAHTKLHL